MGNKRILYFDLLNISACFCVIWLHCNGISHIFSNTITWKEALIVETIAYWAVPVFFMLTGATLIKYRDKYNTITYFKKRIKRTVIPFIIWSIIIFIWKYKAGMITIKLLSWKELLSIFINNKMESSYWYFIPLFAVYMTIPVLSLLTAEKYRKWLWYMVGVSFFTQSLLQFVFSLFKIQYNSSLNFPLTGGGYLIFVLLGYLLSTQEIKPSKRIILYITGIVCAILRYGGIYYLSMHDQKINNVFFNYVYFPSVFLAIAVFVWFKYHNWNWIINNKFLNKIIPQISACSLGIYLIHKIIIINELAIGNIDVHRLIWRTLGAVVTYVISLLLISIMKKLPIIKYIVP